MVSLRRDLEKVLIGPGNVYTAKVTGLFQDFKLTQGDNRNQQFKAMDYAFGSEIDRYALAHFDSVIRLIDAMVGSTSRSEPRSSTRPRTSRPRVSA